MVVALQDDKDRIKLLVEVGFTETQAKLYLTLINMGKTDAKNLSRQANVPRQATYRALGELQEKGLIEKILALPQEYKAIPLSDGLSIMMKEKAAAYEKMTSDVKTFLKEYNKQQEQPTEEKYQISIIEGKDTIIKKSKQAGCSAIKEICILTTLQRWNQFNMEASETVEKNLKRGIKHRIIIEKPTGELVFSKDFKSVITYPNYEIRIVEEKLKLNATLFDDKESSFSVYPSRSLGETPLIWTNHPSLLIAFRDHFEKLWRSAQKVDLKGKIK